MFQTFAKKLSEGMPPPPSTTAASAVVRDDLQLRAGAVQPDIVGEVRALDDAAASGKTAAQQPGVWSNVPDALELMILLCSAHAILTPAPTPKEQLMMLRTVETLQSMRHVPKPLVARTIAGGKLLLTHWLELVLLGSTAGVNADGNLDVTSALVNENPGLYEDEIEPVMVELPRLLDRSYLLSPVLYRPLCPVPLTVVGFAAGGISSSILSCGSVDLALASGTGRYARQKIEDILGISAANTADQSGYYTSTLYVHRVGTPAPKPVKLHDSAMLSACGDGAAFRLRYQRQRSLKGVLFRAPKLDAITASVNEGGSSDGSGSGDSGGGGGGTSGNRPSAANSLK